jgi:hypothetical protein
MHTLIAALRLSMEAKSFAEWQELQVEVTIQMTLYRMARAGALSGTA